MPLRRRYHGLLISKSTQLVVEGYPRCANTYAVAVLKTSQPAAIELARHTHAIAQIKRAYQERIPTLLLIRSPEDAILSYVIREENVDIPLAIRRYVSFHEAALPLARDFVVSDFNTTTTDFNKVILALNGRFALNLAEFHPTDETDAEIRTAVENMEMKDSGGHLSEARVARPSASRTAIKHRMRDELKKFDRDLAVALRLYSKMREISL